MRRVQVGDELRDDARLGDDLVAVGKRGDETARVDLEVLCRARSGEVNDLLLVGNIELGQDDFCALSP